MSEKAEQGSAGALDAVKWVVVTALVVLAIWGNGYYAEISPLYRALAIVGLALVAGFVGLQTEQGKAFNQLRKDAAIELRKVVWPTRQETVQTTLIVLVFVVIVALILFLMDWILNGLVSWVIG